MFPNQFAVADLRGARGTRAPRAQILSISCSFWENLAKSYVGAPSSGKSWIRHWFGLWAWLLWVRGATDRVFNVDCLVAVERRRP